MMIERADQGFLFGSSLLTSEPPPLEKRTGKTLSFCSFCCWCARLSWDIWVTSEIPSFWVSLHWIWIPLVCNHMLTFQYLIFLISPKICLNMCLVQTRPWQSLQAKLLSFLVFKRSQPKNTNQ